MIEKTKLFYERFAVKDFDEYKMAEYHQALNDYDKKKIAEIKNRNDIFLRKYPVELIKTNLHRYITIKKSIRREKKEKFMKWLKILTPSFALLVVCIFSVQIFINLNEDSYRVKGENKSELIIYKKNDIGSVKIEHLSNVNHGDLLQIAFKITDKKYYAIISVDGREKITVHSPMDSDYSLHVPDSKEEVLLSYSYMLDNAPGYESFILITSNKTFKIARIINLILYYPEIRIGDIDNIDQFYFNTIKLNKLDDQDN